MVAMLPELVGGKLEEWCKLKLGVNWLPIVLVIAFLVIGMNELFERLQASKKTQELNNQPSPKPEDISDFYPKIKEYLRSRYKSRIEQKLAWRQPVNLRRLPFHFAKQNLDNLPFLKYQGDEVKEAMAECFELANGRLLVLGDPGTGKTTLLLQLALELMETKDQALPVVLNLATWTSEFNNLHDWLLAVLPAETGANKTLAAQLLLDKKLILLFDGFDEIREEDRRTCLDAISQHGMDARHQYVISSRKKEYLDVANDAPVYFPIEVGHLKIEEIEADLERMGHKEPEALRLLAAIRQDVYLREAVQTPFYLNSLQLLFAKSKNRQDFQFKAKSLKGRKQEIVERFVGDALQMPSKQANDMDAAIRWLSFLASRMTRNNKVVFELVDLQYDWWVWSKHHKIIADFIYGTILGLFMAPLAGVFIGIINFFGFGRFGNLNDGIFVHFISGLVFAFLAVPIGGLLIVLIRNNNVIQIRTYEVLKMPVWRHFIKSRKKAIVNLVFALLMALVAILKGDKLFGLIMGIFILLNMLLIELLIENYASTLHINHPYQRFVASIKSFRFTILQHFHLRWLLYRKSLLPLRLVAFLNEMTERHILESDGAIFDANGKITKSGATWRFRHRILQEYFTNEWRIKNGELRMGGTAATEGESQQLK